MKCEFHVGDYVETVGGFVGWISTIRNDEYIVIVDKNNNTCGYYMPQESRYFNRIGQYDFTKKDEGKIEPLCEEYTKSFPICKTTTANNDSEWRSIDIGVVAKKINELVDAVNQLEEKVNGMA